MTDLGLTKSTLSPEKSMAVQLVAIGQLHQTCKNLVDGFARTGKTKDSAMPYKNLAKNFSMQNHKPFSTAAPYQVQRKAPLDQPPGFQRTWKMGLLLSPAPEMAAQHLG